MSGDYTRLTFDATKSFRGVLKQQGRVSLDSDFNEFEEILDRRGRAEMYDTVGQAVVPITTPDGFKIGISAGQLTIGAGRAYVDGLLAECFGDMSVVKFDDKLGGVYGTQPLAYNAQPFYYAPNYPALSTAAGKTDLVYLDVWKREVTVFEDGRLRDPALGGADTATRVQAAWQVKVLKDVAVSSCVVPPQAWNDLIAPSSGWLTAAATATAPAPGPCVIEPLAGYTGLENRLYRVEVHKSGTVGGAAPGPQAQFKWSRDNASLVASVTSITVPSPGQFVITVVSTGRDAWTRLAFDDYIEFLGDQVEYAMHDTGLSGAMARVLTVNHATGEIVVDTDLSSLFAAAGANPRIKRWDRAPGDQAVRNTNNGTAIPLEEGISVTFGPGAGDTLRAGDYWVFAARTADGKIEPLTNAPPRETLHHFAELALVSGGAVVNDCRKFWPPASCCTVVVRPGESIQHAIDSLNGKGGCVCLKMGVHEITQPIFIYEDNLTLHGEAPWVTVRMVGGGGPSMLQIGAGLPIRRVTVEGISFESMAGGVNGAMVSAGDLSGGHIARCSFSIGTARGQATGSIGIQFSNCHDYAVEHSALTGFATGIAADGSDDIGLYDNTLAGPVERGTESQTSLGLVGMKIGNVVQGPILLPPTKIFIERNTLTDYVRGIAVGTDVTTNPPRTSVEAGCRIVANTITRHGTAGDVKVPAYAIACYAMRCDILENAANITSFAHCGIFVRGGNMHVARNDVASSIMPAGVSPPRMPEGVHASVREGQSVICTIRGNLFTGLQQAVIATGGDVTPPKLRGDRIDIVENRIQASAELFGFVQDAIKKAGDNGAATLLSYTGPLSSILVQTAAHSRVAANEIAGAVCGILVLGTLGATVVENRTTGTLIGIACELVVGCEVNDNIIEDGLASAATFGIVLFASARCTVERNAINRYGTGIFSFLSVANRLAGNRIYDGDSGVVSLFDTDLEVERNTVEDSSLVGILSLLALHEITLAHNRTLRCGYRLPAQATSPAFGILLLFTIGLAIVDSCHVIETAELAIPGAPVFLPPRYGVAVVWAIGARVRNCNILSPPLTVSDSDTAKAAATGDLPLPRGYNADSRALLMTSASPEDLAVGLQRLVTGPFTDATDNVIAQTASLIVELASYEELLFATNRCTNYLTGHYPYLASVRLAGTQLVVTGNRVKVGIEGPSLRLEPVDALSAVGNICSGGEVVAIVPAIIEMPAPQQSFNAWV